VTLVMAAGGATSSAPVTTVRVETAAQLREAMAALAPDADVVVMAAAVADYRPAAAYDGKRSKGGDAWTLELQPTEDILAELGASRREGQLLIGFAAEHGEGAVERARVKLTRKGVDAIVVNDISRSDIGFDSEDNEIVIVTSKEERAIGRRSKRACAEAIWDALAPAGNRLAPTPVGT